jgi:hypothetical protein
MPHFFETISGRRFYEDTAPRIASALERIAAALEALTLRPPGTQDRMPARRRRRPEADVPPAELRVEPPKGP